MLKDIIEETAEDGLPWPPFGSEEEGEEEEKEEDPFGDRNEGGPGSPHETEWP